jgi:hypothetical protein
MMSLRKLRNCHLSILLGKFDEEVRQIARFRLRPRITLSIGKLQNCSVNGNCSHQVYNSASAEHNRESIKRQSDAVLCREVINWHLKV